MRATGVAIATTLVLLAAFAQLAEARLLQNARPTVGRNASVVAAGVDTIARQYGLAGEVLVARGEKILLDRGYGSVAPGGKSLHKAKRQWRLASISKQVTATLLLRDHGEMLDAPIGTGVARPTLRQLLTHHTGLANPDDTPMGAGGVPTFYLKSTPDLAYCLSRPAMPGADFAYNNCDYLIAAAEWGGIAHWPSGLTMARAGEMGVPGFVGGRPEPRYDLASFGAAGGLMGTARAVFAFDRMLMTGKLLSGTARAELWKPEGGRSYQALGQWVFPGTLKGCGQPKRIVQRDGEIGGVQTRNYILPDDDLIVVLFTNRGSDDFSIGEIWQGKGFAYDLLSTVACS